MTLIQLRKYIRYQLSQLSSENGHHDFENLSYEVARRRVAPNLLPATGPVSGGGDQGRDFESYKTYLANVFPSDNAFALSASEKVIAGACTLEKIAGLSTKIKADTATICGSGTKPDLIVYFCEQDVTVAKRHAWIKRCLDTHGVELQIFDGRAISDILIDQDTFWIAEQFLSVPSRDFPTPVIDERYVAIRQKWLAENTPPENFADFVEIKSGTRFARTDAQVDLEAWIRKLRTFIGNGFPPRLEQRARYEVCVAELRGRGSLDPALDLLHMFFEGITPTTDANELSDGAVLTSYLWGACHLGATSLSEAQALAYYAPLDKIITDAIASPRRSRDKSTLLEAHAMLSGVAAHYAEDSDKAVDALIQRWQLVLDEIKVTPLFPVAHIGDIFELFSKEFGTDDRVRKMAVDVDRLVAEQEAAETVGERSLKRATDHLKGGRRIAALSELQRVKSAWLTGETIDGAIMAMIWMARIYAEMNLHFAARYYAAGALLVAVHENNDRARGRIGKAADVIARSFHGVGDGVTYVASVGHAMSLHGATVSDPGDWVKHDSIMALVAMAMQFQIISRRLAPQILPLVDAALKTWPMDGEIIEELKANAEQSSPFASDPPAEIKQTIAAQTGVNIFSDLGTLTEVEWHALGIRWRILHGPTHDERIMALAVAATLQVLQADLADVELAIIPSDVDVRLSLADVALPHAEPIPSNERVIWSLQMPRSGDDAAEQGEALAVVAILLLRQASALPDKQLDELTENKFKAGLAERINSVRPATELMAFVEPPDLNREAMAAIERPTLSVTLVQKEYEELAWPRTKGPGYSRERIIEMFTNRYNYGPDSIARTLPRILADERCRQILGEMRASGMRDWMMLNTLASIVCNWQAEQILGRPQSREDLQAIQKWMHERIYRRETENDPEFPLSALDPEIVELQKVAMPLSTLKNWGLVYRRDTPDAENIRRFLDVRYGYSEDDIAHEDPFPGI